MFSNWNLIRASGFLAYFLLTLSIVAGIMQKLSSFRHQEPLLKAMHDFSGWIGTLTVVFHAILLLFNHYVPYQIREILIPFAAKNDPLYSALGTISFYFFFIVMATSDFFMQKLGFKLWKKIHFLVIPAWVFMMIHSILSGTDSNQPWAIFIYSAGIILVGALLVIRYIDGKTKAVSSNKAG